jgi:sugar phosphate permease
MFTFYLHNSGICVVYTLRVNMSVAAVKMKDDLDWSEEEKGLVLVCFNIPLPFRKI